MDERQLIKETALMEDAVTAVFNQREGVVQAAGGVLYRPTEQGDMEIALVHRRAYDDWSLPKGKCNKGERLEECALREVEEETGLSCLIARSLGTVAYTDRGGRDKVVWYWLMRPIGGKFKATFEVDAMEWMPFNQAVHKLSYRHDRDLLRRARDASATATRVHLVRHADAGARGSWSGTDVERPLTKRGQRQAERLVGLLEGQAISRILSSPATRCRQTVEPLALARGLHVEDENLLFETTPWKETLEFIRGVEEACVMCSHREPIQYLIDHLVLRGVMRRPAARWPKGSTWALTVQDGDIMAAQYIPPP
jgi:8-oxo-dGTP diphosphatase